MKKTYNDPNLQLILLSAVDVIASSVIEEPDDVIEDIFF